MKAAWLLAGGLCAALAAGSAAAQTYQLQAYVRSNATMFSPGPGMADVQYDDVDLLNQPGATQLQVLDESSQAPNGGVATARFLGRIGLLKAYASASHPYCCSPTGQTITTGYSDATAQGSFYDTVLVAGAGLAEGTPVSYRIELSISGSLGSPSFESGGALATDGIAEARLRDLSSNQEVLFRWDAKLQAPGVYAITLNTQVGHSLGLSGMLYAGASVSSSASTGRYAEADFYHSAGYTLLPSVEGLNTVGASGFDFASPVPEPATALLWAAGGLGLLLRQTMRSRGWPILRIGS
jgi:hypothetical protein